MKRLALLAAAALTAATSLATPAAAWGGWHGGYGYHGGYYHHGIGVGPAIGLGLLGLGVGAAIASSGPHYYAPPPAYAYGPEYYPACHRELRWNPYYGDYVPVRVCG